MMRSIVSVSAAAAAAASQISSNSLLSTLQTGRHSSRQLINHGAILHYLHYYYVTVHLAVALFCSAPPFKFDTATLSATCWIGVIGISG